MSRLSSIELPRWAVIKLFKGLKKTHYGRFIEGRHGHPSRFVWAASSVEVGKAAKGENLTISAVQADEEVDEAEDRDVTTHQFNLRPGMVITIDPPADLTEKEADRLAGSLRTLPL